MTARLALALLLAACASPRCHDAGADTPAPDAAAQDASSPYCSPYEQECWCHVAGSNAVCWYSLESCEEHREQDDAGGDTEPCTQWRLGGDP